MMVIVCNACSSSRFSLPTLTLRKREWESGKCRLHERKSLSLVFAEEKKGVYPGEIKLETVLF